MVLHGQFFLDAGRKQIHDLEHLHADPVPLDGAPIDEGWLRRAWNRRLAQDVLAPLGATGLGRARQAAEVIRYRVRLTDQEHLAFRLLHEIPGACLSGWHMAANAAARHRPAMAFGRGRPPLSVCGLSPKSLFLLRIDPGRCFPNLSTCNVVPYDVSAPCLSLSAGPGEWQEEETGVPAVSGRWSVRGCSVHGLSHRVP